MTVHDTPPGSARRPDDPPRSCAAGIGLRHSHYRDFSTNRPTAGWLEVHSENYFSGGLPRRQLTRLRADYPVSLHGVGLSLGSATGLDADHIQALKHLVDEVEPFLVSDHASWSASGNAHLPDLLPLPYTEETVERLVENVDRVQTALGRQLLVENPSSYLSFTHSEMAEYEFMNEVAARSGCGLLLDVNNVFVQAYNHGLDAGAYLAAIDGSRVQEIHLAGHTQQKAGSGDLLVDTHNRPVRDEVWALYEQVLERLGPVPTLIEWDSELPPLEELLGEAAKAQRRLDRVVRPEAAVSTDGGV